MTTFENGSPAHLLPVQTWRKSAHSGGQGGNCVEVGRLPGGDIAVRQSRDPEGPALIYNRAELAAFVSGAKTGEFDDLVAP